MVLFGIRKGASDKKHRKN